MDQLIELLKQIQELSGVAIDALTQAAGGAPEASGEGGGPPAEGGGAPPGGGPEGAPPEGGGGPPKKGSPGGY